MEYWTPRGWTPISNVNEVYTLESGKLTVKPKANHEGLYETVPRIFIHKDPYSEFYIMWLAIWYAFRGKYARKRGHSEECPGDDTIIGTIWIDKPQVFSAFTRLCELCGIVYWTYENTVRMHVHSMHTPYDIPLMSSEHALIFLKYWHRVLYTSLHVYPIDWLAFADGDIYNVEVPTRYKGHPNRISYWNDILTVSMIAGMAVRYTHDKVIIYEPAVGWSTSGVVCLKNSVPTLLTRFCIQDDSDGSESDESGSLEPCEY